MHNSQAAHNLKAIGYSLKRGWEMKSRETARTCSRCACWAFILRNEFFVIRDFLYLEKCTANFELQTKQNKRFQLDSIKQSNFLI